MPKKEGEMDSQMVILSGVISIVTLIVFFVMASNLNSILSRLKNIEKLMMLQAEKNGVINKNQITCPNGHEFLTYKTDEVRCPQCDKKIIIAEKD